MTSKAEMAATNFDDDDLMILEGPPTQAENIANLTLGGDGQARGATRQVGTTTHVGDDPAVPGTNGLPSRASEPRNAARTSHGVLDTSHDALVDSSMSSSDSEEENDESAQDESESERAAMSDAVAYSKLRTGLCYDARMRYHSDLEPLPGEDNYVEGADPDLHPEDPRRIFSIYNALCRAGLVDDKLAIHGTLPTTLARIDARNATVAEICLVHTRDHYNYVESLQRG